MNNPKVSVAIAFKNPGWDFRLAIQSVFAQTFEDWELLLLDDGSTDGSLEFARSLHDERISVFSDGMTRMLPSRLNQSVALARAPFYFRMDADDVMHPGRLAIQYAELNRQSDNTVIGSAAYSLDVHNRVTGFRPAPLPSAACRNLKAAFIHPTVAGPTDWFRRNPYSESFIFHRSQDLELWCRAACTTRYINLPDPLLYYREVGNFSLEKYIGTQLGILYLGSMSQGLLSLAQRRACACRELAKLLAVACLSETKHLGWITKRRSVVLPDGEMERAQLTLERIALQELPVKQAELIRS